jgi:hypothetical protein
MSQVESVALWAGLIASVASIVLSAVAMIFAMWVNNRASEINNQMIRSLQKIESSVEQVSADTRELITAGWNKMLGGIGHDTEDAATESQQAISKGLAAEVRSELPDHDARSSPADPNEIERIERALEELQETVVAQLRHKSLSRGVNSIDLVLERITRLPIEARALLDILASGRHLDRKQYRAAMHDPLLRDALRALRKTGLLVPLEGMDPNGEPVPVYHLPPGLVGLVRIASKLAGEIADEIRSKVRATLGEIGYPSTIKSESSRLIEEAL